MLLYTIYAHSGKMYKEGIENGSIECK